MTSTNDTTSWAGEEHPVAVLVCAIGFFLRILLSEPVLNIVGFNYGGEDAGLLGKVHPGSYLIIASIFILLLDRGNPLDQTIRIARQQTAFFSFFALYILIMIYWGLRGPKGVGLILDIHIVMPICAIVFSYASRAHCRLIVGLYAALAVLNSGIGIAESATHLRLFPFDPEWEVLKQDYFRASALLGHPLTNATFTAVSIFILLDLRMHSALKISAFFIMLSSLIAFGGRSALMTSLLGLFIIGIIGVKHYFTSRHLTVMQMIAATLAVMLVPVLCFGLLYGALYSGMGERLVAYSSMEDESASVRTAVFQVFQYMTPEDIIFGADSDRINDIGFNIGVAPPMSDIENPWVLMFMFLGAVMFTLWLCGLTGCVRQLMKGATPALKIAVIEYFAIASTSNSFGRKDAGYVILAGIVVCAKRLKALERSEE